MPMYEFECPVHGVFERLYSYDKRPRSVTCDTLMPEDNWEKCEEDCPIQVSAPTMKPDKHWAGTVTPNGKVVNSQKEYDDDMKYLVPATRSNREAMAANVQNVKRDRIQKKENSIERFIERQLAGVAIDGEGGTVRQRNKQARKLRRSYSD